MTCIVGIVHEGRVIMGGDSAAIYDSELTIRRDPKVIFVEGVIIGYTSSFRMGQLLAHTFHPPKRHADTDLFAYMVTDFVNAVRECLKAGGYAERHNEAEKAGTFLVGIEGRLFKIESDYQVGESADGYDACGCGWQIARGALFATMDMDPEKRIGIALKAAERFSAGVRGPFTVCKVPA